MAVDHNLIELLLGPGRAAFRAQVVQNQQRHSLDLLKKFIVSYGTMRTEGGPQVVQKVRHKGEEYGLTLANAFPGNGYCQISLARAVGTTKEDPAGGVGGEVSGSVSGVS